ncbi:Sec14 cytosolic factor [Termitomyces sp. T112]|nr:Sec14 cytosolic factor [Termitomyces sp. T112]
MYHRCSTVDNDQNDISAVPDLVYKSVGMAPSSLVPDYVDFFAGHLGHLTSSQREVLENFRANLLKAELYTAPADGTKTSHDDPTLLRFLRARGFVLDLAQKQFTNTEKWREEHDVMTLYNTFDPVEFEAAKRFYPRWTGRRDKNGLPLYVYRLASLAPLQKELDTVPPERRYQRIIALYELMVRFAFPLCSHLPHPSSPTPISSVTTIIDLEHISIGSMWQLRNHLGEASRLATANYPETLNTVVVVNSPPFFPTIWGWIKGWFDEGTRNKIHILGKEPGSALRDLIHVYDLPKPYGGELEWKFEDDPNLDDDAKAALSGVMPKGPVVYMDGAVMKPT